MTSLVFLLVLVGALAQRQTVQREHSSDMVYKSSYEDVVPKIVFDFLEEFNWGDYHQVFHMARKFNFLGPDGRRWLQQGGEEIPELQEGDPLNGIEFLAMHRSMINQLKDLFGDEPVTNDPEGFTTFRQVLDGWTTDEHVIKGLQKVNGDVATFKKGLPNVNNFKQFKTEDEFGNFLQTSLRLVSVDPNDGSRRQYDYDRRPGAGVHNWLHGQFHTRSPITVGNPRSNLANIMFWRIHGWIEAKWMQFEKHRPRTAEEQRHYDRFMKMFDKRMDDMAQGVPGAVREENENASRQEDAAIQRQREEQERIERERVQRETREREERERAERERLDRERQQRELEERRRQERERLERESRETRERLEREAAERRRREAEQRSRQEATVQPAEDFSRAEAARRREEEAARRAAEERKRAEAEAAARREREAREAAEAARRAAEELESRRSGSSSGEYMCSKTSMNVRTGPSLANAVVFIAHPGARVKVNRSKSTSTWLHVTSDKGSGYSYYKERYWGPCASNTVSSTGRQTLAVDEKKWAVLRRKLRRAFRKVKKVPKQIVDYVEPVMFVDHQPCWRYATGLVTPDCPNGKQ